MKSLWLKRKSWSREKHAGFTMNELLIVIAIVAVLVLGLMGLFRSNQPNSTQVVQNRLDVLEQQIKSYKIKYGVYPSSLLNPN